MKKIFIYGLLLCCLTTSLTGQVIECDNTQGITSLENKVAKFKKEKVLDSLIYYTKPLVQCYQSKDSLVEWAMLHFNLASATRRTDPPVAIAYLDSIFTHPAYRNPVSKKEQTVIVRVLMFKAFIQRNDSRYIDALSSYEKAAEQYELYQLTPLEAKKFTEDKFKVHDQLFKPLGNIYTRLGDNEKARNILKKALAIGIELEDWESVAGNYANIGITYWDQDNNEQALHFYAKGMAIDSVSDYRTAMLLAEMANSYHAQKNDEIAIRKAEEALKFCKKSKSRKIPGVEAGIYQVIASIYLNNQDYTKANTYVEKARNLAKNYYGEQARELSKLYILKAQILTAQQQYRQAIRQYNLALSTILPAFQPTELNDLPNKDLFYKENTIFEALNGKAGALHGLYQVSKDKKHLETALKCHELALEAELNLRRDYQYESSKLYLQSQTRKRTAKAIEIAYLLYQKTNDEQYVNRAFRLSENSRAVLLLEGITQNFVRQKRANDSLFIRENDLKLRQIYHLKQILTSSDSATIARHKKDKLAIENQLEVLQKQLEKRYPQYKNEPTNRLANISVFKVKNTLVDHTDFVEYFQTDDALYAFKINNKKADFIKINVVQKDINTIKRFLNLFENDSIRAYTQPYATLAYEVYNRIYSPLDISPDNQVIIVPEGALSTLPFDALLTRESDANDFGSLPYLLHRNRVNYAYSAAVYLQDFTKNKPTKNKGVLALAPIFKGQPDELLESEKEISQITRMIHGTVFKNEQATQAKFIADAPYYDILHLSTHANAGRNGRPPQIRFSDTVMLLPELYTLRLSADLAVLSACETALGKDAKGEGVMSLARGFTYAGVPRLVTSLWQVNDAATADLMTDFYQHLKADLPTAQALHEAKLTYLNTAPQTSRSPYFWAGFVHIGQSAKIDVLASSTRFKWWAIAGVIALGLVFFLKSKVL